MSYGRLGSTLCHMVRLGSTLCHMVDLGARYVIW